MINAIMGLGYAGVLIVLIAGAVYGWLLMDAKRETLRRAEDERREDEGHG